MTKPGTTGMHTTVTFFKQAAIAFVVGTFILVGYAGVKVRWAKKQVDEFSRQVVIGMPVAGLEKRAIAMHLKYRPLTGGSDNAGKFMVWQGFAYKRWFCTVEYRDGKVVAKKSTTLD